MVSLLVQEEDQGVWHLTDLEIPDLSSRGTVLSTLDPQLECCQYVLQKLGVPAAVWLFLWSEYLTGHLV